MQLESHAIVVGGSLAGLLAGRALANHFDQVTIIERDVYPAEPEHRPGLPQSRFPHTLLMRGLLGFEQFFPGLRAELLERGAVELDAGRDIAYLGSAGWLVRCETDLKTLAFSRDLLDWLIRRRLSAFPNVHLRDGTAVTGLLSNPDRSQITGVLLQKHDPAQQQQVELFADLIVDASGKSSRAPQWLTALGYDPPQTTEVNGFLGYTARLYQCPDSLPDWKLLYIQLAPPARYRGGAIFPIEGNRWIVGLGGGDHDYPPTDEADFLEFARSLPTPALYDAICDATPLSPIYSYRGNENCLRHYDQMSRQPERFVVVGHAACAFNPTYGQGMTVAALEAELLDQFFQRQSVRQILGQTRQLQRHLARAHRDAWMFASNLDYRYRSASARPNRLTQIMNWYFDQIAALVTTQPDVCRVLLSVMQMVKPATALFQPFIIWKVWQKIQLNRSSRSSSTAS